MALTIAQRQRVEELLRNWWLAGAATAGSGWSGPQQLCGSWAKLVRQPSARLDIPALTGKSERTDRAMNQLTDHERAILTEAHFSLETVEHKARRRKMHRVTYWQWVRKAEEAFFGYWSAESWKHRIAPVAPVAKPGDTTAPQFFESRPWRLNAVREGDFSVSQSKIEINPISS